MPIQLEFGYSGAGEVPEQLEYELRMLRAECIGVVSRRNEHTAGDAVLAGWCVPVAFLVRSMYGGEIVHGIVTMGDARRRPRSAPRAVEVMGGYAHYWNRLPGGTEVDLTSDQFKGGDGFHPHPRVKPWAVMLEGALEWAYKSHKLYIDTLAVGIEEGRRASNAA